MTLSVIALADQPLDLTSLPRLRPTSGLGYEKHDWAPALIESVPGLGLRKRRAVRAVSLEAVQRVAVAGTGTEVLLDALFQEKGGPEGLRIELSSTRTTHPLQQWRRAYAATLRLDFLREVDRVATPLGSALFPVDRVAIYALAERGDLRQLVQRVADERGVEITWLDAAPFEEVPLGLPLLADLPVEVSEELDLSGFNLAELPDELPCERLSLDDTAVTELAPLRAWPRLRGLSLRGLDVRSLEPVRHVRELTVEAPSSELLRELAGSAIEKLVLIGDRLPDLSVLSGLSSLRVLELHGEVSSLAPLAALPLRELTISSRSALDATPLSEIASLRELTLAAQGPPAPLAHPERLARLGGLHRLALSFFTLSETDWLASLGALHHLELRAPEVVDGDFLHELRQLVTLDLSYSERIVELAPLTGLTQLRELDISGVSADAWLHVPEGVRVLTARRSRLPDLWPLERLVALEKLSLGFSPSLTSLEGLSFPFLRAIELSGTPLQDLSPLAGHAQLARVEACGLSLRSVEPIALSSLRYLDLSDTTVSELNAISAVPLHTLLLTRVSQTDLSFLKGPLRDALKILAAGHSRWPSLATFRGMRLESLQAHLDTLDVTPLELPELQTLRLSVSRLESSASLESLPRLRELALTSGPSDHSGLLRLHPLARLEVHASRVRGELRHALARRHRLVLTGE